LAAALDERGYGSDVVVKDNGVKAVYTKDLENQVKNMRVDYLNKWYFKGFRVY